MADELIWSMQNRRDTASNWTNNNPILLDGQIGIESDTKKIKIGNGINWNDTDYFADSGSVGFVDITGDPSDNLALETRFETVLDYVFHRFEIVSSATPTATINGSYNLFRITNLAIDCVFQNPTGFTGDGNRLLIIIENNSTLHNLSFVSAFRFTKISAPTTIGANEKTVCEFVLNVTDNKWDCILNTDATSSGAVPITADTVPIGNGLTIVDTNMSYTSSLLNINGGLFLGNLGGSGWGLNGNTSITPLISRAGSCRINLNWPSGLIELLGITAYQNQYSTSSTPSISMGAGAGTSPTSISITGNNKCLQIKFTTGVSTTTNSIVATVNYSGSFAFPNGSIVALSNGDGTTSVLGQVVNLYTVGGTTSFDIKTNSAQSLTALTAYTINAIIEGY